MELFLNILWLVIAAGALAVWRLVWKRQRSLARHRPLQEWTAFACALIFVFFAVSLSDDLQAAAILAEDCASGRHHALVCDAGHGSHHGPGTVRMAAFVVSAQLIFPGSREVVEQIAPSTLLPYRGIEAGSFGGRSPPFFSF